MSVETTPDPFDPAALRLAGDLLSQAPVRRLMVSVPVRKPDKTWFVRTHPDPAYQLQTAVIEIKEAGELYLVQPSIWGDLLGETTFSPRLLRLALNRQNVPFIWPLRLPGTDGRLDSWGQSAHQAATAAENAWVRIQANMSAGGYDVFVATGQLGEPAWPDVPFAELLRVAFRDRLIDSTGHPVLRRLRGEL